MKALISAAVAVLCLLTLSLNTIAQNCKTSGVYGYVTRATGNQMPDPNEPIGSANGYKTTVYVYQLTNLTQVERKAEEPAYIAIRTKLVRTVKTTSKGYFFAKLPAGQYSLFVKVNGLFYANSFDERNNINPLIVQSCRMMQLNIRVDAGATY